MCSEPCIRLSKAFTCLVYTSNLYNQFFSALINEKTCFASEKLFSFINIIIATIEKDISTHALLTRNTIYSHRQSTLS